MSAYADFLGRVAEARDAAEREARKAGREAGSPHIKSRGTHVATSSAAGQCHPHPEAECHVWGRTKRELDAVVADVIANHPHVLSVYVAGGYDGYENPAAAMEGSDDYEPWLSEWNVTYWERA